jgi:hypothetical protein
MIRHFSRPNVLLFTRKIASSMKQADLWDMFRNRRKDTDDEK